MTEKRIKTWVLGTVLALLLFCGALFVVFYAHADEPVGGFVNVDREFDFNENSKDMYVVSGYPAGEGMDHDGASGKTARIVDGTRYFSVRATLPANAKGAFLRVWMKGDHQRIDISNDGIGKNDDGVYPGDKSFETLFCTVDSQSDGSVRTENKGYCMDGDLWSYALRYFPLDDYLVSDSDSPITLDFKFMDAKTDDGNGINILGAKVLSGRGIDFDGGLYYMDAVQDGEVNETDLFDSFLVGGHVNGDGRIFNDKRNYEVYRVTVAAGVSDPFLVINADFGDNAGIYLYNSGFDGGSRKAVLEKVGGDIVNDHPLTYVRLHNGVTEKKETFYLFVRSSNMESGSGVQFGKILVAEQKALTDTAYEYESGTFYEEAKVTDMQSDSTDDNAVLTRERYFVQGGSGLSEDGVFYDGPTQGIYKYDYRAGIESLKIRLKIYGSYVIGLSGDNSEWTTVAIGEAENWRGGGTYKTYTIDATDFTKPVGGTLYIKIGDYTNWDGWGPHAQGMAFVADYGEKATVDLSDLDLSGEKYADFANNSDLYGRYMGFIKRNAERFADGAGFFEYKVALGDGVYAAYAQLNEAKNASVSLSADGENFEEVWYSTNDDGFVSNDTVYGKRISGGWIELDLNAFRDDKNGNGDVYIRFGAHNKSAGEGASVNSLRFVHRNIVTNGSALTFEDGIGYLRVPMTQDKVYSYSVDPGQEALFVSGGDLGQGRFYTDSATYVTYKVQFPNGNAAMRLLFKGRDKAISYSTDGRQFDNLFRRNGEKNANIVADGVRYAIGTVTRAGGYYAEFELESLLDNNRTLYIRFEDCEPSDGLGTQVHELTFYSDYTLAPAQTTAITFGDAMIAEVDIADDALLYDESDPSPQCKIDDDGRVHRFADADRWFTYKILFDEHYEKAYAMLDMCGENLLVEVSVDNATWQTLACADYDDNGATLRDGQSHYFSFESYLREATAESGKLPLYIRFAALDKNDGNGADLYGMTVYCAAINDVAPLPIGDGHVETAVLYAGSEDGRKVEALSGSDNADNFTDSGTRFFDCNNYATYRFSYDPDATAVRLNIEMQAGYRLSLSTDGARWYDLDIADMRYALGIESGSNNMDVYQYDITRYLDGKGLFYVRMGDMTPLQGWGGSFVRMIVWQYLPGAGVSDGKIWKDNELNAQIPLNDESLVYSQQNVRYNYFGKQIDSGGHIDYRFEMPEDVTSFYIAFKGTNVGVKISANGNAYEAIPVEYYLNANEFTGSVSTYNLSYFAESHKTVFVRFEISGQAEHATLYSLYAGYNRTLGKGYDYAEKEYLAFLAGSNEEKSYRVAQSDGNIYVGAKYTEFRRNGYGVYRFDYDAEKTEALKLMATVSGTFVISVSADGDTFTDLVISEQQYYFPFTEDGTVRDLYIDVSRFTGSGSLCVRIADAVDDNAYGAQLRGMGIVAMSGERGADLDAVANEQPAPGKKGCGCASSVVSNGWSIAAIALCIAVASMICLKRKNTKQ